MDLILTLLDEKEVRLLARRHSDNDFAIARKAIGARYLRNINYTGHFVFRDDAEDIKAHPFFRGIEWSLHLHASTICSTGLRKSVNYKVLR